MPRYARVAIPILVIVLFIAVAWYFVPSLLHHSGGATVASVKVPNPVASAPALAPWQRDVNDSLEQSVRSGMTGNLTDAMLDVDRADSLITTARLESHDAQPKFFMDTLESLDRIMQQREDDPRLFDHVMQARIALAELRTSLAQLREHPGARPVPPSELKAAKQIANDQSAEEVVEENEPASSTGHHVPASAPRQLHAGETLDPRSLGGDYLDASLMSDSIEILMPPQTRSFNDAIRVRNLTIAGAAQTLDGIRWQGIAFIGTHVRYESGDLDLQNVHFVNCMFGIPSDANGMRLANTIAEGLDSITIEVSDQ